MKQFFFACLWMLGVAGISSCNNGPYDADSKVDKSAVPNWLDPKYPKKDGEMKFDLNGETQWHYGNYTKDTTGLLAVAGVRELPDGRTAYLGIVLTNYSGTNTYNFGENTPNYMIYSISKNGGTQTDTLYQVGGNGYKNISGSVQILSEDGVTIYGSFEGSLRLLEPSIPEEVTTKITEGYFRLRKN